MWIKNNKISTVLGFSLLEIIIGIAIVATLALLGMSIYQNYSQKANREIAKTVLRQDAAKMEQHYSQYGSYLDNSNTWPDNYIESYINGTTGAIYSVSFVPAVPTLANQQVFNILASPVQDSIQSSDSSGRLCINQTGNILENATANCATTGNSWNSDLCAGNVTTSPAVATCAYNDNCSNNTICGSCSGGNGAPGSCSGSYVGGACSGDCSGSFIVGNCDGNCSNSTVCGSCSGDCSGVNQNGC